MEFLGTSVTVPTVVRSQFAFAVHKSQCSRQEATRWFAPPRGETVWLCFERAIALALALLFAIAASADDKAAYSERLAALADKCEELGLAQQAEATRRWHIDRHPGRQYLFLPGAADVPAPKADAPQVVQQWYARFIELRRERANQLFSEAIAVSREGHATRSYQLLHEVLREDPSHAEARRILGYVKGRRGEWELPGAGNLTAQTVRYDHPKLGWRRGSWWRLETPHFQIVTNHSAKEALEAGRQIEDLHALWRQLFFRYWSTPEALAARIAGSREPFAPSRPKMQVVLFKNRDEYAAQLGRTEPQISLTLGYYHDRERMAFFFAGDTSVHPTWYHEATHQLFQEAVPRTVSRPGEERNFWAVEGAALYMESLVQREGYWTVGGWESDRLQFARYRALSGDFALPIERLTALSRRELQSSEDLRPLYAHSAAVAHYLIDGESGRHQGAFVDLLSAIYRGQDDARTLVELTGKSFDELDGGFRNFLNVTDDDLLKLPAVDRIRNLSLGRTSVTDRGVARLAGAERLQWLDLTLTQVSDAGLESIGASKSLRQLFLEGTKVTQASLPLIASFSNLEELDLAKLPIHDDDLRQLVRLRNLKSLYLTGCPITDAGLVHLRGMKQLELLETTGTQVTAEGRRRLEAAIPKLRSE